MSGIIYEPKGKAGEYAQQKHHEPLAANLYTGCGHGCDYCYAPRILYMKPEDFWGNPRPKKDVLKRLETQLKTGKYSGKSIFLCFTCDAYQPIEYDLEITRQALEMLRFHGVHWNILTKSCLASRDFDLYRPGDKFGMTLVYYSDTDSAKHEPGAFNTDARTLTLWQAHQAGIDTWVSLEPVINPKDSIGLINRTAPFVNEYKIGKVNYKKSDVDWKAFGHEVVELLEKLGKKYYIKDSLRKEMEK